MIGLLAVSQSDGPTWSNISGVFGTSQEPALDYFSTSSNDGLSVFHCCTTATPAIYVPEFSS
jgi:hypothetical protein